MRCARPRRGKRSQLAECVCFNRNKGIVDQTESTNLEQDGVVMRPTAQTTSQQIQKLLSRHMASAPQRAQLLPNLKANLSVKSLSTSSSQRTRSSSWIWSILLLKTTQKYILLPPSRSYPAYSSGYAEYISLSLTQACTLFHISNVGPYFSESTSLCPLSSLLSLGIKFQTQHASCVDTVSYATWARPKLSPRGQRETVNRTVLCSPGSTFHYILTPTYTTACWYSASAPTLPTDKIG